jgi:hypothetical protein
MAGAFLEVELVGPGLVHHFVVGHRPRMAPAYDARTVVQP